MHASAEDAVSLSALLSALGSECNRAAHDLARMQTVLGTSDGATPRDVAKHNVIALQDLDRLTQTLAALGRMAEALRHVPPSHGIDPSCLRAVVALDSVTARLLDHVEERDPVTTSPTGHTTLF
ncbi:MAG: hypothetical protein AAFV31_13105 [Pseudomonadota bacterium]